MNSLSDLLASRIFWEVILGYWIFSAIVSGMPMPKVNSSAGYVWAFRSLHTFAGNLDRAAMALKVPGAQPGNGDSAK